MKLYFQMFIIYLISIVIFLGSSLIVNYQDLSIFFDDRTKLFYFLSVLVLNIPAAFIVPFQSKISDKGLKEVKSHKLSLVLLQLLPIFIIICSSLFESYNLFLFSKSSLSGIIGNILFILGFCLMNYSAFILGKQFNVNVTIIKDHQLITNGPYSIIRHPRYLGIQLTFSGIPLIFNTYMPLLFSLIILLVILWRINDEEFILEQTFSEQWKRYTIKTKKLIPFIW